MFKLLKDVAWQVEDDPGHLQAVVDQLRAMTVRASARALAERLQNAQRALDAWEPTAGLLRRDTQLASVPLDQYKQMLQAQQTSPVQVTNFGEDLVWWFEDRFYQADADIDASDIAALAKEKANSKRLRIEKARALEAMNATLDSKAKRQPIPQEVKMLVWQRDGGRCVACGSNEALEYDHIIPLAMGGSNTDRNLQLLCEVCNRRKGATLG